MSTLRELGTITNCRDHRRCGLWTNATDARDALAGSICPEDCFNTAVESRDPHIYLTDEHVEFCNDLSCHCGQAVARVGSNFRDGAPGTTD